MNKFKSLEFDTNLSIEDLEKEIARNRFDLKKDNSPYVCPICKLPFYIERICESGFDEKTETIIPHSPIMTVLRK